jgi:hypothetical protein
MFSHNVGVLLYNIENPVPVSLDDYAEKDGTFCIPKDGT